MGKHVDRYKSVNGLNSKVVEKVVEKLVEDPKQVELIESLNAQILELEGKIAELTEKLAKKEEKSNKKADKNKTE